MPRLRAYEVCAAFGLGRPLSRGHGVAGGFTHKTWRLQAEGGTYAVKLLHQYWHEPERRRAYEGTFELERQAVAAGLPAAEPVIAPDGSWLVDLTQGPVRVHRWVDGVPLRDSQVGIDEARRLGGVLAAIHGLDIRREVAAAALLPLWTPSSWDRYALELPELRGLRPTMERLRDVVAAGRSLVGRPVLSHGDLNEKNLLRRPDGGLVLLDWDSAEPADTAMDAAGAAAGLGGLVGSAPRPAVVRAFMRGYRDGGGELAKADYRVFAGLLNGLHGWLFALYRRAVSAPTAAERAQSRRLAGQLARRLPFILDSLDSWARLLA
jgi:Ser/Thr protein kinase RdoA (MazF antagonist)